MTDVSERRSAIVERRVPMRAFGDLGWPARLAEPTAWSPPIDIEETDDASLIEAEHSSVTLEDVNIEVVGDDLSSPVMSMEGKGTPCRQTRRTGRFAYRATLPSNADAEKIDARLAGGVRTVRVRMTRRDQRRRTEITAA